MLSVKERNRLIKKVLAKEFGYKNVRVKGLRGTAYNWVHITVTVPKPHVGSCEEWEKQKNEGKKVYVSTIRFGECEECKNKKDETKRRIWEILEENDLVKELGRYYDDMLYWQYECIIDVKLVELDTNKKDRPKIIEGNKYYKVV